MNVRDVHDESTADSSLCLLLDLFGYDHNRKLFRLFFGFLSIWAIEHDPRSLKLHVVPSCRFVQHESLNLDVTQDINQFFLYSSVYNYLLNL